MRRFEGVQIDLWQGDLTLFVCDAMVNAANKELAGGGGVDVAIHRAGGPSIMAETREKFPDGCATGTVCVTGAGDLPCSHVIHTVGPVWSGGTDGEPDLLRSCYIRSLAAASLLEIGHISFPSISTGVYGYPVDKAAKVAMDGIHDFLATQDHGRLRRITLVQFSADDYDVWQQQLFARFPEL